MLHKTNLSLPKNNGVIVDVLSARRETLDGENGGRKRGKKFVKKPEGTGGIVTSEQEITEIRDHATMQPYSLHYDTLAVYCHVDAGTKAHTGRISHIAHNFYQKEKEVGTCVAFS